MTTACDEIRHLVTEEFKYSHHYLFGSQNKELLHSSSSSTVLGRGFLRSRLIYTFLVSQRKLTIPRLILRQIPALELPLPLFT